MQMDGVASAEGPAGDQSWNGTPQKGDRMSHFRIQAPESRSCIMYECRTVD